MPTLEIEIEKDLKRRRKKEEKEGIELKTAMFDTEQNVCR